jgi:hypothetical protein
MGGGTTSYIMTEFVDFSKHTVGQNGHNRAPDTYLLHLLPKQVIFVRIVAGRLVN